MFKKETGSIGNISLVLIIFVVFFYVLYVGASLIIPFIIALLFSFAIIALSNFYKKMRLGGFIAFTLSLGTYVFIFWILGKMLNSNLGDLIELLPKYQTKVLSIVGSVFEQLNINEPTSINQVLQKIDLQYILGLIITGVTFIFSKTGIILFYVLFILLEYRYFSKKLQLMILDESRKKQIFEILEKIKGDIKSYFVIKTVVSFITATVSYMIMRVFDLDLAIFWAFLIFVLNFIPSVGSVIAVTFPILLTLMQFESYYPFAFISVGLIGIQVLMGNIIEPRFLGNKLNLSPLVIILGLAFWGSLWGVVGMLLSVPIMVIINIILAKIPATRSIAILLSEKGELQIEAQEEVKKKRRVLIDAVKKKLRKKK
ncbi:AI-2E family transporter [Candidatus Gracilibacteria bacterium 28_42_T64]|nr:AI-2E family transporter [Candidatus Gracilibacteria bacterium 28_42_T64]